MTYLNTKNHGFNFTQFDKLHHSFEIDGDDKQPFCEIWIVFSLEKPMRKSWKPKNGKRLQAKLKKMIESIDQILKEEFVEK